MHEQLGEAGQTAPCEEFHSHVERIAGAIGTESEKVRLSMGAGGWPVEFTSASGECKPFGVVRHLTTDRLKEECGVSARLGTPDGLGLSAPRSAPGSGDLVGTALEHEQRGVRHMSDFVICARNIKGRNFGSEPAPSTYLVIKDNEAPRPGGSQVVTRAAWAKQVQAAARSAGSKRESHVLVFVHGYNNPQVIVMQRHRRIRDALAAAHFPGIVVSFDWPAGDKAAFYLEDLADANRSAIQLVADGIMLLASLQEPACTVHIHLLAHSMGAYVTREGFTAADDADDLTGQTWRMSQVMLIAPDISARSLRAEDSRTNGLYRNCTRLTCYSSRHDNVLGLSNVKRAGVAPRAGRVGLPDSAPSHAVNVDCSGYYETIPGNQPMIGKREHSWHIGDPVFTQDMIDNMLGMDRDSRPTRDTLGPNRYVLRGRG